MEHEFLGKIPFETALRHEAQLATQLKQGCGRERVLAFEPEGVVTLGARGQPRDLLLTPEELMSRGFSLLNVPRGGQATLHNPGQLIIFPVIRFAPVRPRIWVNFLAQVTQNFLADLGLETRWEDHRPGLYSARGKVMSMGLRLSQGISTHGLAINVHNELEPFSWIRACGDPAAAVDRLQTDLTLESLFERWVLNFKRELTSLRNSPNLGSLHSARS